MIKSKVKNFTTLNDVLSFIKTELDGRINLDKKFHNLIINVFDANNNQIQIHIVCHFLQ